ncbi:SDR family NAD(P)-dependent oxidoreductase [Acidisphaera sp. L21]|uniref:SDR family NAD(P)-dependent oxidoreductase n=1 Tax=Acidisphaera sp. L21 TaxID=1641851 RepID=UPI00131B85D8|nr:SDR family NAD(P)-dependent oxidoreductase [Acidisphaera sp. L21]
MRNVLVTGGSRGLGLGIAQCLARCGFQVIALARQMSDSFSTAQAEIAAEGIGRLEFHAFDLSQVAEIPAQARMLRQQFGPFYGLVNNAGLGTPGILSNMPDGDIAQLLRLNVEAPLVLTKYMLRSMMTAREGRVVNITSIVASTGYSGMSAYSATKAAMTGFTRSLAREVGPLGITVNAVAPGFVDTAMTSELTSAHRAQIARRSAMARLPEVADVAAAVEFLFSENAKNITGTVMTVDAGNTA